jgi:hypothetical protein
MISFKQVAALCGAFALFAPAPALAEWVSITSTGNERIYIEDSSIERTGNLVSFWRRMQVLEIDSTGVAAKDAYQYLNCLTGNWAEQYSLLYSRSGKIVYEKKYSQREIEVLPTIPGSASEIVYNFVCR